MTGSTAVHRALECVAEERDDVEARKRAFETFEQRIREVPAANPTPNPGRTTATAPTAMTTAGGTDRSASTTAGDRCVTVRDAFADVVEPHSTADLAADEPLVETIAAELTEDIAVALATETGWTPALKTAVLEAVTTRRHEAALFRDTLRTERRTLEAARDEVDEIVAWLRTTADESLLQYDFDALQAKHEQLESPPGSTRGADRRAAGAVYRLDEPIRAGRDSVSNADRVDLFGLSRRISAPLDCDAALSHLRGLPANGSGAPDAASVTHARRGGQRDDP